MNDDDVIARIRDADPLREVVPNAPLGAQARQALLTRITSEPDQPVEFSMRAGAGPVHRWAAVAAVVLVVAGVGIGIGIGLSSSRDTHHSTSTTGVASPPPIGRSTSVVTWARSLLAATPLPPGVRQPGGQLPASRDPVAPISRDADSQAYVHDVGVSVHPIEAVDAYLEAHRPSGWRSAGRTSVGPGSADTAIGLDFLTRAPTGLVGSVHVSLDRYRSGTAIRVFAQGARFSRSGTQRISAHDATSATVVLTSSSPMSRRKTVLHRTMPVDAARATARRVNAALPALPAFKGFRSCPMVSSRWTVQVRFGRSTLTVQKEGCISPVADVNGFAIAGGDVIAGDVLRDLGLPAGLLSK